MVVVEYLYEDMKKLVDLPLAKMVEGLSQLGAPSEYESETRKIITELTPNRPDWYSMEGLARALRAYYKKESPAYATKKSSYTVSVDSQMVKIRPYTACAVVKGLKLNDQRITDMVLLQEKLLATLGRKVKKFGIGIYPLHAISFPVRYTAMRPEEIEYVPLGSEEKMNANEILERHKKGQQYGHIIKGQSRYPVFVDAQNRIMALIPIVNSAETGKVDLETKDIFIEVTGTDMNACSAALNILVCTFADMGGKIHEVKVDYGKKKNTTPDLEIKKMMVKREQINGILGLDLSEKEMGGLLLRMGYGYEKGRVLVPPYRADILSWIDITEDIAIAYGYNNFKPTLPDFFFPGMVERQYDDIDGILRGMGFIEMKSFILTNKERVSWVGGNRDVVEIENPSTEEYTVIRPDLVSCALEVLAINKMRRLPQKFYEIGLAQCGKKMKKKLIFCVMDRKLEFADMRGYLQTLAAENNLTLSLAKKTIDIFEPTISCEVILNSNSKGIFGKVNKNTLEKFGLGFEVYLCELELD